MIRFQQNLGIEGKRRFEFFYRDGKYWKQDSWSQDRWELSKEYFWNIVEDLPFFRRGTHIHTIHGEIMERVFVKKI